MSTVTPQLPTIAAMLEDPLPGESANGADAKAGRHDAVRLLSA